MCWPKLKQDFHVPEHRLSQIGDHKYSGKEIFGNSERNDDQMQALSKRTLGPEVDRISEPRANENLVEFLFIAIIITIRFLNYYTNQTLIFILSIQSYAHQ